MFKRLQKLALVDREKTGRIHVVGDLHGDLRAFRNAVSHLSDNDLIIFLGDYTDRGPNGLEVIEELMALVNRRPEQVIPLKGNHESYSDSGDPRFFPCTLKKEVNEKRGGWNQFFSVYKEFTDTLFLSAIIPDFALLLHGGISEMILTAKDLETPSPLVTSSILWSDPGEDAGSIPSPRGIGELFGPDITNLILDRLQVRYLIRSHQPSKAWDGPFFDHAGRVITTNGPGMYGGEAFLLELETGRLPDTPDAFRKTAKGIS